jgi:hypothetical protein
VGVVEMALNRLTEKGVVCLDEERTASMVTNLMVVSNPCSARKTALAPLPQRRSSARHGSSLPVLTNSTSSLRGPPSHGIRQCR